MFGRIKLEEFSAAELPAKAAAAWQALEGLTGASYKPLLYLGTQPVKGLNHRFIAEQTLITAKPIRRVVLLTVNEFKGEYKLEKQMAILAEG